MQNPIRKLGAFLFLLSFISSIAFAQNIEPKRMALIIGVKSYQFVQPLQNSLNDARDLSATLKAKGFQVIELYDPKTKREMQDGIREYFALLETDKNAAGLMFYSGHGMQVDGSNYLIPTLADPQIKADLDDQCVNMDYVMRAIEQAGNGLNIFILDACRNNPFRSFSRSADKGLTMVSTPQGSYIVYATKPGSVASDGTGRNGLFTSKLLKYINADDLNIEQVFKRVAADVATESNDAQRPWIASDYTGDFYFTPGKASANTQVTYTQPILRQPETNTEAASMFPNLDFGYGTASTKAVMIGNQQWISQNLNVDHFANGDPIPQAQTEKEWRRADSKGQPAWCCYNNDPANGSTYGKLYNWYAVNDTRGLAPRGWHVPSDIEWDILIKRFVANGAELNKAVTIDYIIRYTTEGAGASLKNSSGWTEHGNGTNASSFAGLPGGGRFHNGDFFDVGKSGRWWSSSKITSDFYRFFRTLYYDKDIVQKNYGAPGNGFSVRCVRD